MNPLRGIIKPRDLFNPYIFAGLAGHVSAKAEIGSKRASLIDGFIGSIALNPVKLESPLVPTDASLWHGTGRYKYNNGEIVDVLQGIAQSESLLPNHDRFDLLRPMNSISLAKSRMYARAYADMFGSGHKEDDRYGSSLFWACSFLGSVAIEASKEAEVWKPSGYYRMLNHLTKADAVEWYKKVTRTPNPGVVGVYGNGSDIHENYPVLFGVREVDAVSTSKAVALHEVRSEAPLWLSEAITHVEVPRNRIDETVKLLGGLTIQAIEDGEGLASQYTYTEHMHASL